MKLVVAAQEPHLRSPVAPQFETAPYFLLVDTLTCRARVFPNPVQYQVECSPTGLVHRLKPFAPELVMAGSFCPEAHKAALALRIPLQHVSGCASDAVDQCLAADSAHRPG